MTPCLQVYLDAWKYVRSLLDSAGQGSSNSAVASFASNWTSPEFEKFVDDLASAVDELSIQPSSQPGQRAKEIWKRIVELEETFWPEAGEEVTMKIHNENAV